MIDDAKFRTSQRNHLVPPAELLKASVLNKPSIADERDCSLVLGERGRVHFAESRSDEERFRLKCKKIERNEYSGDIVERGKKFVPIPKVPGDKPDGVRYLEDAANRRSDTIMIDWDRRAVVPGDTGRRTVEYEMEKYMNRKTRVSDAAQRNHIHKTLKAGDKAYNRSERSAGFFTEGGLISGSTIKNRISKQGKSTLSTTEERSGGVTLTATYAEKKQRESLENDLKQVTALTNGSMRLGQAVPSWEEKTGLWLVSPENEKD